MAQAEVERLTKEIARLKGTVASTTEEKDLQLRFAEARLEVSLLTPAFVRSILSRVVSTFSQLTFLTYSSRSQRKRRCSSRNFAALRTTEIS